jgi:hypothetical protein
VFDIPFNSANKWSLAVTSCPGDSNHQLVMMKGAPEIILTKCSHHLHNNQEKEIDDVSSCCLATACVTAADNMSNLLVAMPVVCGSVCCDYLSYESWLAAADWCCACSVAACRTSVLQ